MSFFLDVFNNLLKLNETEVMIIFDTDGEIWFKFKDILVALEYNDVKHGRADIKINNNYKKSYDTIRVESYPPFKIHPQTMFINESGLYEVLSLSTKPIAKQYMNKYFTEIMQGRCPWF